MEISFGERAVKRVEVVEQGSHDTCWHCGRQRCKVVEGGRKFAESTSARIHLGSAPWECVCPQALSAGHSSGGLEAVLNAGGSGIKLCVPKSSSFNPVDGKRKSMEATCVVTQVMLFMVDGTTEGGNVVQLGPKLENNAIH